VATDTPLAETVETSGKGTSLTVRLSSTANLLGYETASYAVRAKPSGIGLSIVPLYADRHIGAETERRGSPAKDYFQFASDAAFYRVFYEAQETEYAAIIVAARILVDLEQRSKILGLGTASCEKLNNELCVAVPKQVAINGLVPVTVNGGQTLVAWGTNIGGVLRAAGEREANAMPRLQVHKSYNGRLVPVEFDRANSAVLNLIVSGGEVLSWK
jgi:hypothetical protein